MNTTNTGSSEDLLLFKKKTQSRQNGSTTGTQPANAGAQTAVRPAAQTTARPAAQTAARPAAQTAARPAAQTAARPAQTAARPAAQTAARPAAQTAARPAAQTAARPAQTTARPAAQTTARPAAQTAARPAQTAARPAAQTAARPAAQTAARPAQTAARPAQTAARPAAQTAARPAQTTARPAAQTAARPAAQTAARPAAQPTAARQPAAQPAAKKQPMDPEKRAELLEKKRLRRRKMTELRTSAITMIILVPVFCLLMLYTLILPRSTVSKIENRNLATFPKFTLSSYFSGDFTEGVADWFDDTVPNRDTLKNISYKVQNLFGITTEDTITYVQMDAEDLEGAAADTTEIDGTASDTAAASAAESSSEAAAADSAAESTEAEPETSELPDEKDYTAEEAENSVSNGMLIVKQDGHWRGLVLYGGGSGTAYAEALNYLRENTDSSVNIYSMPAIIAAQFYLPSNAAAASNDQEASMQNVEDQLVDGITWIDLVPVMQKHTEEAIYTRTDHHWAPLGAFYAAQAFAETAGVPFADLSTYDVDVAEGYVGTLYAYSQDSRLNDDPEDFVTYIPTCEYTTEYYDETFDWSYSGDLILDHGTYLNFMGTDDVICKVTTAVKNGRKLLMVKDSYGNAEIPCYTSSFEEIYVTDMRYLECNLINMIEDLGITDVLFTMCTVSVVGGNADNLMNLMTQNADVRIVDNGPNVSADDSSEAAADDTADTADETADTAADGTETAAAAGTGTRTIMTALPLGLRAAKAGIG